MYLIEFGPQLFNKNVKKQNLYLGREITFLQTQVIWQVK